MKKLKAMVYAWISEKYMHGCSNYNSLAVRKSCRSKAQGRRVFADNNIPRARGTVFLWPWTAHQFAKQHGFPLVVKPNVSGYSRGSYFPINSFGELWRAIALAKIWWPTTIIEQYLSGANYRVLATDHSLISVIRRYPPFVTGNGRDTIGELIDEENRARAEMQLHPVIFPIAKSEEVIRHLKKHRLTLESVPTSDQYVELFYRVALAPGGVVEVIDQTTIPDVNRDLFQRVVSAFDANVFGIDVIFEKGIETSYLEQKCIFIEVNSRPYMKMHHYPRYGVAEDLSVELAALDKIEIEDKDTF